MDYASVRVRPVPWVGSCGATANILLVHDPRGLADAPKRRSKGGMGLGVERRIALIGVRFLARNETYTYQGDTSFHSESHATFTPALGGISETTRIVDQKYVGSCPAGAHPGDRTNADGSVIHSGKH